MRVADQIVEFVEKVCASNVFVLTGNGAMYLNDAIEISETLSYTCVRNEAAAPIAASSYSDIENLPGVVCVTAGPGSTNAIAGLAEVWVDSGSILILSGQVPSAEILNYGRSPKVMRTFGIAGIPVTTYIKDITKYSAIILHPSEVRSVLKETYKALLSGRKGPVWIDLPLDVQSSEAVNWSIDELIIESEKELKETEFEYFSNSEMEQISNFLNSLNKPMILLGRGILEIEDFNTFKEWIIKTNIPFATSRVVAHKFDIGIKNNLGVLGVRGRAWSKKILGEVDGILSIGSRIPSSIVGPNYEYLNREAKLGMIDIDIDEINRHGARVTTCINKSLKNFGKVIDGIRLNLNDINWPDEATKIKSILSQKNKNAQSMKPLSIYWFVENLEDFAPKNTVLTTDAGSNYYACGQSVKYNKYIKEITSGTFAAMGLSLPLAIGAAAAIKKINGQVFCITGDGSIELNIQELQTLSTYKLPVKIFVINNGGYASMRTWQDTFFNSRYIGSTDDTGARPLNFSKVADAFGINYEVIKNEEDFQTKIGDITKFEGPMLIEVICDSNEKLQLPMNVDIV